MISTQGGQHPNCMYEWMNYIISPQANAAVTVYFGEAPVSAAACAEAEKLSPGWCDQFHAADEQYFKNIWYWNTPTTTCLDGRGDIVYRLRRLDAGLDGYHRQLSRSVMTSESAVAPPPASPARRLAAALYRRPRVQLAALLAAPLGWLVIAYLGALALFLISSFWSVDSLTGNIITKPTLANYQRILTGEVYPVITARTVIMAAIVTLTCIIVAFPIAFYMARVASGRVRGLLIVSILLPLWSGYLVKVYAWRLILSQDGVLNWALAPFGLQGPGYSDPGGLDRRELPLAAVHDHPDLCGSRADPQLTVRGVRGPRRQGVDHLPARRRSRSSCPRSSPAPSSRSA